MGDTVIQIPNIYQRMRLVTEMVQRVQKESYNQHHRYAYAGHEDVTAALAPAFVKVGIVQVVDIESIVRDPLLKVTLQVAWVNVDAPEDRVVVRAYGEGPPEGKGGPMPQQVGIAVSYALKVAQLKNFSIVTGEHIPDAEESHGPDRGPAAPEVIEGLRTQLEGASTVVQLREFAKKASAQKAAIGQSEYNALAARLGVRMQQMARAESPQGEEQ